MDTEKGRGLRTECLRPFHNEGRSKENSEEKTKTEQPLSRLRTRRLYVPSSKCRT